MRETFRSGLKSRSGLSGMSWATKRVDLADRVVANWRCGWLMSALQLRLKSIDSDTVVDDLFCSTNDVRFGESWNGVKEEHLTLEQ